MGNATVTNALRARSLHSDETQSAARAGAAVRDHDAKCPVFRVATTMTCHFAVGTYPDMSCHLGWADNPREKA
jgi:hypothetical protein